MKKETRCLLELGDHVTHKDHPEMHGIVSLIERGVQNTMRVALETWNEGTQDLLSHALNIEEAVGDDGETFVNSPFEYEEYFPLDDEGEFKFRLGDEYHDLHTDMKGNATSHGVCITGCDRAQIKWFRANKGLYGIHLDLNRLTHVNELETADNTIEEHRRDGGPPICRSNDDGDFL